MPPPADPDHHKATVRPLLDPVLRISEILYGLIMALTFTGSLSAATAGQREVRTMLIGALGCNIAWGLIDAVMFLIDRLTVRRREREAVRLVRAASDPGKAHEIIANAMPQVVASSLPDGAFEAVRARLRELPESPSRRLLTARDWLGAMVVFCLVVVSTFPVVVPFFLTSHATLALRISNTIAIVMLFFCGFRLGQYGASAPWKMGLGMVIVGGILIALTIALGG